MALKQETLTEEFSSGAGQTPVLDAEAYRLLLEKLLAEGQGYGKTQNVAAYKLRNITFATEHKNGIEEQQAEMPDLYVVIDTSQWRNEYIRKLGMKDIAVKWSARNVSQGEINTPDFKGPGIWTAKKEDFEFDYNHAGPVVEHDETINSIYVPNPEAYRVCLKVTEPVKIPTPWEKPYLIDTDGTVAIRERDVADLSAALQSIRDGKTSVMEALYKKTENGKLVARFDVYGMEPGFLENNYNPVALKPLTQDLAARFAEPANASHMALENNDEPMIPQAEAIVERYRCSPVNHAGSVFWARGGTITDSMDQTRIPINDELAQSFIKTGNYTKGDGSYNDLLSILDPHGSRYIRSTGRGCRLLPQDPNVMSHFEQVDFWRRLSVRFVREAEGTIHVAASGGIPSGYFRMFEYSEIMKNDKIEAVEMIEGTPNFDHLVSFVDPLTNIFVRNASYSEFKERTRSVEDTLTLKWVSADMIVNEDLKTLGKNEWAEEQKKQWFENSYDKLQRCLKGLPPSAKCQVVGDMSFYPSSLGNTAQARDQFLGEIVFSLHETKRLKKAFRETGASEDNILLRSEQARLAKAYAVLEKHPELLEFKGHTNRNVTGLPPTITNQIDSDVSLIQNFGQILLSLDNTLSVTAKTGLWGIDNHYLMTMFDSNLGKPGQIAQLESYVRNGLDGLNGTIQQALTPPQP